jgi:hypothetical protein
MCKERITVIRTGRMESALAVGNRTEPKTAPLARLGLRFAPTIPEAVG